MPIRMISEDDLIEVAERWRAERGEWPSVRRYQDAVRTRFHHLATGISSDRARVILNELRLAEAAEPPSGMAEPSLVRAERIRAKAAAAAKRRRKREGGSAETDAQGRIDDLRELLTEAIRAGSRGDRVDAVVPVLLGRFQSREATRVAEVTPAPVAVETLEGEPSAPDLETVEPEAPLAATPDAPDELPPWGQDEAPQPQLI